MSNVKATRILARALVMVERQSVALTRSADAIKKTLAMAQAATGDGPVAKAAKAAPAKAGKVVAKAAPAKAGKVVAKPVTQADMKRAARAAKLAAAEKAAAKPVKGGKVAPAKAEARKPAKVVKGAKVAKETRKARVSEDDFPEE